MKPPIPLLRKAVRLFNSELVPRRLNKINRIAWLRAVHKLGDRWVALPMNREQS